jgi:Uma2 family endonuclease
MESNWASVPLPILVVEVASNSTRRRDRVVKRGLYTDLAIPEYWMVDRQNRSVRIIRGDTDIIAGESFEWHPVGTKNPLVISLADLFGAVT